MAQDNLQSQSDQELQFKKRARRRLVGAIALVLLMIVILPMVLQDRTAQAPKQDVVVTIPSQDNQTLVEKPVTAAPIQHAESAPATQAEAPTNAGGFDPQSETKPTETKPTEAKISEVKPVEAKPAESKPVQVAQVEKPVAPKEATKQETQKLEAPKPAADNGASYFVQIGVFSDPENVKQMQVKLTGKGLKSRSDLIDTSKGKKTRLRVGPFSAKKDAESALDKIKSLSLTGVIVGGN